MKSARILLLGLFTTSIVLGCGGSDAPPTMVDKKFLDDQPPGPEIKPSAKTKRLRVTNQEGSLQAK